LPAFTLLLLLAPPALGGLYTPDDPCPFTVDADGTAAPLPHPIFVAMLVDRYAPRVPVSPSIPGTLDWYVDPAGQPPVARSSYAARLGQVLAARWPQARTLSKPELAAHTAILIRFGMAQQALNLLDRGRIAGDYALKANRVHAFAAEGQWADAVTNLPDPSPKAVPLAGTTPEQYRWQQRVDEGAYSRWLNIRDTEARTRPSAVDLLPDALFATSDGTPIRYWESEAEADKLPADAVAVVQQLLLWAPWDDRLLWALAEVYFAKGRVREAHSAYRMLASDEGRRYKAPRLLGQHLQRVAERFADLPPEESSLTLPDGSPDVPPPPAPPAGLVFGLIDPVAFVLAVIVFAAVLFLMFALQIRAMARRRRRS
jgi:hypothetical protein